MLIDEQKMGRNGYASPPILECADMSALWNVMRPSPASESGDMSPHSKTVQRTVQP